MSTLLVVSISIMPGNLEGLREWKLTPSPESYPTWAAIAARGSSAHWMPSSRYRKIAKELNPSVARTSWKVFV